MRAVNSPVPAGWRLRAAVPDDAPALAALCQAHAAYERIDYDPAGHADRLRIALDSRRLHAWLVEQGEQAMGYAAVTLDFATLSARPFLHLDCLYLDARARGQGWGEALMDAVQRFGRAQGCANLQWQTPSWNHGAIRFYDRLGALRLEKQRYTLVI